MTCNCCIPKEYWSLLNQAHLHPYWRETDWTPSDFDPRTSTITVMFCLGIYERWIRHIVWQYDEGLKVNLLGIPVDSVTEVQWANEHGDNIIVVTPTIVTVENTYEEGNTEQSDCLQVDIPNDLLTTAGKIYGYIVNKTENTHLTLGRLVVIVNERAKTAPETEEPTCCDELLEQIEQLKARIEALENP